MKLKYLSAGFVLSYAAIFIQSIISVLYTPIMLRILGQNDYGLLQLAIGAVVNLSILSFGFGSSYMRFYSEYRADNNSHAISVLNGMFIIIFTAAAISVLICGAALSAGADALFSRSAADGDMRTLKILLIIMSVNLALSFIGSVFDSYIAARESFTFQKILVILSAFLSPAITLPFLLAGSGVISVAVCTAAVTLARLAVSGAYCIKKLGMSFRFSFDNAVFKRLSVFSFFIFLNIISDNINWSADKVLLGIFGNAASVTEYSLGAQINSYFLTFSYALSSLLTPRAHSLVASGYGNKRLSVFFSRFGRIQFSIMAYIFLLIISIGRPFMRLWSGLNSDIPYFTAVILTAPLLLTSIQSIGIEIQRAKDMHRFRSVTYALIAVFNIIISVPLCIRFGAVGCAAGTCAGLVIGNIVIMNIYYKRRVGLDIGMFWKNILSLIPPLLPAAAAAAVIIFAGGSGFIRIILYGIILTAVYWPLMYCFGIRRTAAQFEK